MTCDFKLCFLRILLKLNEFLLNSKGKQDCFIVLNIHSLHFDVFFRKQDLSCHFAS